MSLVVVRHLCVVTPVLVSIILLWLLYVMAHRRLMLTTCRNTAYDISLSIATFCHALTTGASPPRVDVYDINLPSRFHGALSPFVLLY